MWTPSKWAYKKDLKDNQMRTYAMRTRIKDMLIGRKRFARKVWRYAKDTPECRPLIEWAREEYMDARKQLGVMK